MRFMLSFILACFLISCGSSGSSPSDAVSSGVSPSFSALTTQGLPDVSGEYFALLNDCPAGTIDSAFTVQQAETDIALLFGTSYIVMTGTILKDGTFSVAYTSSLNNRTYHCDGQWQNNADVRFECDKVNLKTGDIDGKCTAHAEKQIAQPPPPKQTNYMDMYTRDTEATTCANGGTANTSTIPSAIKLYLTDSYQYGDGSIYWSDTSHIIIDNAITGDSSMFAESTNVDPDLSFNFTEEQRSCLGYFTEEYQGKVLKFKCTFTNSNSESCEINASYHVVSTH